jgi:hypothetical protein
MLVWRCSLRTEFSLRHTSEARYNRSEGVHILGQHQDIRDAKAISAYLNIFNHLIDRSHEKVDAIAHLCSGRAPYIRQFLGGMLALIGNNHPKEECIELQSLEAILV